VKRITADSAEQLFAATHDPRAGGNTLIRAPAVTDYRPQKSEAHKIQQSRGETHIDLGRSPDTLASVAKLQDGPFTVGFAAETDRVRDYARGKLQNKRLDMIVANKVGADCGFDCDDNAVEVYWRDGEQVFPKAPKTQLARALIDLIASRYEMARTGDTQTELPVLAARE
jgi:phosphopantothenoylcysteine decarboxylase/phosphopantothenate--cysteine ligase